MIRWLPALVVALLGAAVANAEPAVLALRPQGDQIWLATSDGVVRFAATDGSVAHWGTAAGLPNRLVVDLAFDANGVLWVATPDGPARLEEEHFVVQAAGLDWPETTCLLATPAGALYAGTGRGLAEWRGERWEMVYETHEFGRHRVLAAAVGDDGTRWFAKPRSLMRIAPDGSRTAWFNDPLRAPVAGGLEATAVDALSFDRQGRLWLAAAATLEVRDGEQRLSLERYRPGVWGRGGLPSPAVRDIEHDAGGGTWLAFGELEQRFIGLRRARSEGWQEIAIEPPSAVFDLAHDERGNLWAATANGLYELNRASEKLQPRPYMPPRQP